MKHWEVSGADSTSGENRTISFAAQSEQVALVVANSRGILVSEIRQIKRKLKWSSLIRSRAILIGIPLTGAIGFFAFHFVMSKSSGGTVQTTPVLPPPATTYVLTVKLTYTDQKTGDLIPESKSAVYVVPATASSAIDEALSETRAAIAAKFDRSAEAVASKILVEKQLQQFEAKEKYDEQELPSATFQDMQDISNGTATTGKGVHINLEITQLKEAIKDLHLQDDQLVQDIDRLSGELDRIKDAQLVKLQEIFKNRCVDAAFADSSGIAKFSGLPASDYVVYSLPFNLWSFRKRVLHLDSSADVFFGPTDLTMLVDDTK